MIQTQLALLRREIWEHRAISVVPIVVAIVTALTSMVGQVSISEIPHLDAGIIGLSNVPENARSAALSLIMVAMSTSFIFAMWILTIFYTLDALYAERKDRSILFWRSMPVTDFDTVLSKLLTALFVIPIVTLLIIMLTHIVILLSFSVQVGTRGGSPWTLIWSAAPFFDIWSATLVLLIALPLWLSPFIGWFLFVSAYTKRSPLLVAAMPIVLLPILESFVGSTIFRDAFFVRSIKWPLFGSLDNMQLLLGEGEDFERLADADLSLFSLMDLGGFLSSPQLWSGLVVCGLFTAAAIYVRRYKDDS